MRQPWQHLSKYNYPDDDPREGADGRQLTLGRPNHQPERAARGESHAEAHDQTAHRTLQTCRVSYQTSGGVPVTPENPYEGKDGQSGQESLEKVGVLKKKQVPESPHDAIPGTLGDITYHQAET